MIVTTTDNIGGSQITDYLGIVSGDDIQYSATYGPEYLKALTEGRAQCFSKMVECAKKLEADAIIGVKLAYKTDGTLEIMGIGITKKVLITTCSGTAVKLEKINNKISQTSACECQ